MKNNQNVNNMQFQAVIIHIYNCIIDCHKQKYPILLKTKVVVAQNQQVLLAISPL